MPNDIFNNLFPTEVAPFADNYHQLVAPFAGNCHQQVAASLVAVNPERIYQQQMLKNQRQIKELLRKQIKNGVQRPDYINKLIEAGLIYPDGITALAGLDKIAYYLIHDWKMDFCSPELLMQFRQKNGKLFSLNTAREAVKRAKNSD